ncbi:MAG: pitrilysin family protein [Oscillospiraceae bacterium]
MNVLEKAAEYKTIRLDNGLVILLHEMPEFSGVHAIFATNFGSIDREFTLNGKHYELPAGVAHFLEHKMFENEDGDAFEKYAKTGANANAYTGFDKTSYIFQTTDNVDESMDILLNFVTNPYFTEQTVKKEQGIIGQEIGMYDDAPDWRMMFALLECLYSKHPIRDDIAGSVESISKITPELLYACTDAFYRTDNMVLSVAGNITEERVLSACKRANIKAKSGDVTKGECKESTEVNEKSREIKMSVSRPILGIGFKEIPSEKDICKQDMLCDVLNELIVGEMTPLYRKLYDEGLIDDSFGGEYLSLKGALCFMFSGETCQPEKVRELLLAEISRLRTEGVDEEIFTLCKNMLYGVLVANLENADDFAVGMVSSYFKGYTLASEIETLAAITLDEINDLLQRVMCEKRSATVIIKPLEEN